MKNFEIPEFNDFNSILQNKSEHIGCSPKNIESKLPGIAINTPLYLNIDSINTNAKLCLTYTYSSDDMQKRKNDFSDTITIVMIRLDNYEITANQYPNKFEGQSNLSLGELIPGLIGDDEKPNNEKTGRFITGWLNIDLKEMFSIKNENQRLVFFATADNIISNIRITNIIDDKKFIPLKIEDFPSPKRIEYDLVEHNNNVSINGSFSINQKDKNIGLDQEKHKALNIIVTSGYDYRVIRPFKDMVLFKDDLKQEGDVLTGKFNLDLTSMMKNMAGETFNVIVSFGPYVSEVKTFNWNR